MIHGRGTNETCMIHEYGMDVTINSLEESFV